MLLAIKLAQSELSQEEEENVKRRWRQCPIPAPGKFAKHAQPKKTGSSTFIHHISLHPRVVLY